MTAQQLDAIVRNGRHANYVAPVPDYDIGWELYMSTRPETVCRNSEQRRGYHAARKYSTQLLRHEATCVEIHGEYKYE